MKKRRQKHTFKVKAEKLEQPAIREWQVVLAEINVGTASVGIRFNKEDTVHFFMLHKTPTEAAQVVAQIANQELTLKDIALMDWTAVEMKHEYMQNSDEKAGE